MQSGDAQSVKVLMQADTALKQKGATKDGGAIRTTVLAKRIRLLGISAPIKEIAEFLQSQVMTPWGRQRSAFVGGGSDPLDQHEWFLPQEA